MVQMALTVPQKRGDPFFPAAVDKGNQRGMARFLKVYAKLKTVRVTGTASVNRHNPAGDLLLELLAPKCPLNLDHHLFSQLEIFDGMEKKAAETDIANRDLQGTRAADHFCLCKQRNPRVLTLIHRLTL